ncbi:hypothetical protein SSAG_00098 [Streptomyces sp. Mg1]|nr:hypothetical protein SSAG_00098 [Streptomyces sp. Mg1]
MRVALYRFQRFAPSSWKITVLWSSRWIPKASVGCQEAYRLAWTSVRKCRSSASARSWMPGLEFVDRVQDEGGVGGDLPVEPGWHEAWRVEATVAEERLGSGCPAGGRYGQVLAQSGHGRSGEACLVDRGGYGLPRRALRDHAGAGAHRIVRSCVRPQVRGRIPPGASDGGSSGRLP